MNEPAAGPGAQSVAPETSDFVLVVPENVNPGDEVQVYAGSLIVRVRCPPDCRPGQYLAFRVPADKNSTQSMVPNSPNVKRICNPINTTGPAAYVVTIPSNVRGGQQFPVIIQGRQLMVTCPQSARPGMPIRVVPPRPQEDETTQFCFYEVALPREVHPGEPFASMMGGQRVLATCPPNANAGQRIRFKLPLALFNRPMPTSCNLGGKMAKIKLDHGWTRAIHLSDVQNVDDPIDKATNYRKLKIILKFQWVRINDKGGVDMNTRFDINRSAYVCKLVFHHGDNPHIHAGLLSLVPAMDAAVDSKIKSADGHDLVTCSDIAHAQAKGFEEKADWFHKTCAELGLKWDEGHMRINVRRQYLLEDSVDAVMSFSRNDLRKMWRFAFIGKPSYDGCDGCNPGREWFHLVTQKIFDPDMGLWQSSQFNPYCMQINPASEFCHKDHLIHFRFLGRVMGKALFDGRFVHGHMVQHLYKYILGWPCVFSDLERVDEEYYKHLKQYVESYQSGEDLSLLCLNFTTTQEVLGNKVEIELVKGGADLKVDNDNFPEYLEACFKYQMLDRVKPQLNELLLGFFDVIPEPLLMIFDFQELELLMCRRPHIDIDDWKEHTEYSGEYDQTAGDHEVCKWFWEVVGEFDPEMMARLLQFVTGASAVPAQGFGMLQGRDGNVCKFTIHGVNLGVCYFPRAHIYLNRIDLPMYESKEDLRENLKIAVTMVENGFLIE